MLGIKQVIQVLYNRLLKSYVTHSIHQVCDEYFQKNTDELSQKINKNFELIVNQKVEYEVLRINHFNVELQEKLSQQVADEFVKMYQLIETVKSNCLDEARSQAIAEDLIQLRQSIEKLEHWLHEKE